MVSSGRATCKDKDREQYAKSGCRMVPFFGSKEEQKKKKGSGLRVEMARSRDQLKSAGRRGRYPRNERVAPLFFVSGTPWYCTAGTSTVGFPTE